MGTTISESHKFIFVHIPKTAGLSIASQVDPLRRNPALDTKRLRSALNLARIYTGVPWEAKLGGRVIPEHSGLADLRALDPTLDLDAYYKFAVVRNPWDRIVSFFTYNNAKSRTRYLRPGYWRARGMDFETWLETRHGPRRRAGLIPSQFDMITLPGQTGVAIDKVVRFEELATDFAEVATQIGLANTTLPALNKSKRGDYRDIYTDKTREMVAELYKDDIEAFGYRFA